MKNKILAAIDIGTNTFRLLIASLDFDSLSNTYSFNEIYSERVVTRLGEGLHDSGLLNEKAIERSISVLTDFSRKISCYKVHKLSAIATSALREARNSSIFLLKAKEFSGLDIEVISGEREAEISSSGMLIDMKVPASALLLDIGGGSTELICYLGGQFQFAESLNLGVVSLAGKYMNSDPPSIEDLSGMEKDISRKLDSVLDSFKSYINKDTILIGTAGTVTALAAVTKGLVKFEPDKIHKTKLSIERIRSIFTDISSVTSEIRAMRIPFEPSRLDIIVPGTLILLNLMETLGFGEITVSIYGLREGILVNLYNKIIADK